MTNINMIMRIILGVNIMLTVTTLSIVHFPQSPPSQILHSSQQTSSTNPTGSSVAIVHCHTMKARWVFAKSGDCGVLLGIVEEWVILGHA